MRLNKSAASQPALAPRHTGVGRQLTPLADWLAEQGILPLTFLEAALSGCAPRVIRFGAGLYITRADAAAWRDRLWLESVESSTSILAEEAANAS